MTGQEQAFRAYYASMTDAELQRIAVNKTSFIDVAQKILADELVRRNLAVTLETLPGASVSLGRPVLNVLSTLAKRLGGAFRR